MSSLPQLTPVSAPRFTPLRDTSGQDRPLPPARRHGRWLLVAAALLLALLSLWLGQRWLAQRSGELAVSRAGLRIATVTIADVSHELNAAGRVVAAASPTLYSPAQGTVSYRVQAGDSVSRGQLLATIDSPTLTNLLAQQQAELGRLEGELGRSLSNARQQALLASQAAELARVDRDAARRELRRAERSWSKRVIAEIDYQAAIDELARAELRLTQAEQQARLNRDSAEFERQSLDRQLQRQQLQVDELERQVAELAIRSPVTGMVGSLALNQTSAVIAQQPLLTVVDLTRFDVEVLVPESYADDLGLQLPVVVQIGSSEHPAAITAIAPEVIDNQVAVRLRFIDAPPANLRQNQRLAARILLSHQPQVVAVERGPFVDADLGSSAFRLQGDHAERVAISLGAMGLERVEIRSGLQPGDQIIVSDTRDFRQQQRLLLTD